MKKTETHQPQSAQLSESLVRAVNSAAKDKGKSGKKKNIRCAGGQIWMDPTLEEWDPSELTLMSSGWILHLRSGTLVS